jgi:hypothetical protein
MVRRDVRSAGRLRLAAVAVASALVASTLADPVARAEPAPELSRAKELYKAAEAAMADGRFDDAIRDYGAAYELSRDPALFFKIGRANERAGTCEVALSYYRRYLREGKPDEKFAAMTRERIAACGGEARSSGSAAPDQNPTGAPADTAAPGGAAPTSPPPSAPAASAAPAAQPSADRGTRGAIVEPAADAGAPAAPVLAPSNPHKVAWVLTGTGIALATLGSVLAYAADSSENDIRDLYVGFAGQPPTFDARTQKNYNELIDRGRQYEHLSWAAFGLAGAAGVGAIVLFFIGGREDGSLRVAPVVTNRSAGVAVTF